MNSPFNSAYIHGTLILLAGHGLPAGLAALWSDPRLHPAGQGPGLQVGHAQLAGLKGTVYRISASETKDHKT